MRLIDSDALIEELNNSHFPGAPYIDAGISIAIGKVCDAPTIEPSAQPEIIRCKECKYWKDSDGVYRRGFDAESKCPLNLKKVYEGTFYCGMAERRTDE